MLYKVVERYNLEASREKNNLYPIGEQWAKWLHISHQLLWSSQRCDILKDWRKETHKSIILHLVIIFLRNKSKIMTFSDEGQLKQY